MKITDEVVRTWCVDHVDEYECDEIEQVGDDYQITYAGVEDVDDALGRISWYDTGLEPEYIGVLCYLAAHCVALPNETRAGALTLLDQIKVASAEVMAEMEFENAQEVA